MKKGDTRYSERIDGDAGNYGWRATFAITDGYVNIMQKQDGKHESVLLSPAQFRALLAFVAPKRRRRSTPARAAGA